MNKTNNRTCWRQLIQVVLLLGLLPWVAGCGDTEAPPEGNSPSEDSDAGTDVNAEPGQDLGVDDDSCAAALGLYEGDDCETLQDGILSFTPQYPLWSDGVTKKRFVYIPPGEAIDVSEPDGWVFPVGTKFWKHFQTMDGIRLETRVLEKTADLKGEEGWVFETYAWNAEGDEVTYVEDGLENVLGTNHDIPELDDCSDCHSGGENQRDVSLDQGDLLDLALGFGAIQLNHDDSATTLESLFADGWLSESVSTTSAVIPGDATAQAALGYLHGNCGSCHGGASPAKDITMFVPVGINSVEDTPTYQGNVSQATDPGERATGLEEMPETRIAPGDPDNSALLWRMKQRSDDDENDAPMPPLATEIVDDTGVSAIEAWIESL